MLRHIAMKPVYSFFNACLPVSVAALATLAALTTSSALAQSAPLRQDHALLRQAVEHFLGTQTTGLPGKVTLTVGQVDPRLNLQACIALEPFMPNGSRVWGKTTVGVRCNVPAPWTVYIPATVQVVGNYVTTAGPVSQGQMISAGDLTTLQGDLTALPAGIITDPAFAVGKSVTSSLAAGTPLRQDVLRSPQAVQQGQIVKLISGGPGFRVSAEARALANGAEGQVVQARTASGQVVSGVAKAGGVVEVTY